jgi:hypothetical protein
MTTPEEYQIREITRVNFGGDYENALHLVGGEPTLASVSCPYCVRRRVVRSAGKALA